jgi:hypothetical protein
MAAPKPALLVLTLLCACSSEPKGAELLEDEQGWRCVFEIDPNDWSCAGRNDWFVLEPGYRLVYENERKTETLSITVLDETRFVDNVETRVVEERETAFGKLKEVSRNYFAISRSTHDVYYFGEDVDMYKNGAIDSHEGSWQSGVELANFGLMLPAQPVLGAKWYQEMAPEVALDRCEVLALDKSFECPAGKFTKCLEIEETTPLESTVKEKKLYAPGIGLVKDGSLRLVSYGKATEKR